MDNINSYMGRQAAWHQKGNVTGHYMTWDEIEADGGLDYIVRKVQLQYAGVDVDSWGTFRINRADLEDAKRTGKAVPRDKAIFLGPVGKDYTYIPHQRGFRMIDGLMKTVDGAHYETAGALGEGQVVWGLADLKLTLKIGDDVQKGYLLFSTSHDASLSNTFRLCMTRVVCQNTLNVALGEKSKAVFKVRHTKNAESKMIDAHNALEAIGSDVKSMEEKLNLLAGRKVTKEALVSIMDRLFPGKRDDDGNKVDSTRRDNMLAQVLANYESNDRNAFPEQRGTAYNLLNAVTEYVDHDRSSRGNMRSESAMFGSGDVLKTKALQVIMENANGMPELRTQTTFSTLPERKPMSSLGGMLDSMADEYEVA